MDFSNIQIGLFGRGNYCITANDASYYFHVVYVLLPYGQEYWRILGVHQVSYSKYNECDLC